ncbi:putative tyrosine carboxypeptidase MATCAP2 isoform X3 [Dendrobates tinctorius]|uniref:putative tyrosine carboxypeptidase MATCAP2 isoform X3 n=1 Tax=Dendrobates tinctorius TaxID=92724 RepID=UPI003CC9E378
MLESICVTETLHWPKKELSRKSVLNVEKVCNPENTKNTQGRSMSVLRDTFTTGTSSYNVQLQGKEGKKQQPQKESFGAQSKKRRKGGKLSSTLRGKELHKTCTSSQNNSWMYGRRIMPSFNSKARATPAKYPQSISVAGNSIGFSLRPKIKTRRRHFFSSLTSGKEPEISKPKEDVSGKKICILNAIKPLNVEKEKIKFFKSAFLNDPQFEYANPALPNVLVKHSYASDKFLKQAVNIMLKALEKYGSYEKFEQATGGYLLPKSRIWHQVRKYMEKEGCLGEIVVHLTDDLLSRASMTVVNGRPTLTINMSTAREQWLEGMLRHEIGCFNKDQVYLDGILRILRHRETIDFRLLTAMGKVSYEDIEHFKDLAVLHNARVPQFLQDRGRYLEYLEKIMHVNDLTDEDLSMLIG